MKRSEQKLKNMDLTVGETIGSGAKKNSEHMASDSLLAILGSKASTDELKLIADRKTNKEDTVTQMGYLETL